LGLLVIDHSQGQGIDGRQGKKVEYETKACAHCDGVIAILAHYTNRFSLSSIDVAAATPKAHQASDDYVGKHRCTRCHANVCRACALAMKQTGGVCPGPFKSRVEAAVKKQQAWHQVAYRYR
jgi:hypothetical protein